MASELSVTNTTGTNVYAILIVSTGSDGGKYWKHDSSILETFSAANWGNYDVPLTEDAGTGIFRVGMPAVPSGNYYDVLFYARAGGSPAVSDTKLAAGRWQVTGAGWLPSEALKV